MRSAIESHLGSRQVSRVVYGSIIGLALVVALEDHPPTSGVIVGTLIGTAFAVGLAELFSEVVGIETSSRRHARGPEVRHAADDALATGFGIAFPVVLFVLAAADAIEQATAFTVAKWSGVGLLCCYGYAAARLAGDRGWGAVLRGLAAGLIGVFLIVLKALVH